MAIPLVVLALLTTYLTDASPVCNVDCAARTSVTVSLNGGDCDSIQAAVNCAEAASAGFQILVRPGIYREQVLVRTSRLSIIGQSPVSDAVTLTWSVPGEAVLNITANDFLLANLTVFNDANQFKIGKNFALYATGDRAAIFYSSFYGAQDTIYTGYQRVYFWGSIINGSSDFLYGQGSAVWDNCTLIGQSGPREWSFLTAHAGENVSLSAGSSRSAYLIHNSRLPKPEGAVMGHTWLGRPWGLQSTVIYYNVWMDEHIAATGWNQWHQPCGFADQTCARIYYAEFNSSGPGGVPGGRVHWSHQLTVDQAANWTVGGVLRGWSPPLPAEVWAVPYTAPYHSQTMLLIPSY